jgi:phage gpG-like protein
MATGFQLQWTIEGETQLSRVLLGMASSMQDMSYPFGQSAEMLKHTFAVDVFDTQGAAIGETWKPLSPATVAAKARTYGQTAPLIATGNMRASFTTEVAPDYAIVANQAEYFKYHQSNQPRKKIPRRPMMALTNELKEQIVKFFQLHIQASMKTP